MLELEGKNNETVIFSNPDDLAEDISITVGDENLDSVIRKSLKITSSEDIFVSGAKVKKLTIAGSKNSDGLSVVLVHYNKKLFYLSGRTNDFDQIIGSMRFISDADQDY